MMQRPTFQEPVGGKEPQTPTHSLPSYDEPTPETRGKISREEEAELALKDTEFQPGTRAVLIALFLITIVSVSALQLFGGLWPKLNLRAFLHATEIKAFEKQLESDSVAAQWLLPPTQFVLTGKLGAGNEQVYLGRDGWLFYRPDVDYIIGPGFLTPARLKQRGHAARIQPDPVRAIVQFRDQLAARGIDLLVVPIPGKPSIDGEMLSARARPGVELQNASFADFKGALAHAGVRVFDPAPALLQRKAARGNEPAYLATDTHWRPETMEFVAGELAAALRSGDAPAASEEAGDRSVAGPAERIIEGTGDIARMLRLPKGQEIYTPQTVKVHEITSGNGVWQPSREAEVLVLGDSFANIFSLDALGWGESAGLVEQLSQSLGGRPLDSILRNSDGAFATREMLSRELARGRDRLSGKKLVIWEFAQRELALGDWKLLEMKLGQSSNAQFFSPKAGETVEASGTVEAVSAVPRPGTAPYRDHIMAVQLADLVITGRLDGAGMQSVIYLWSMRDNVWTSAARLRPGDHISLRLRAWSDVSGQYEQINRSEIDDPAVQLEEPAWGELAP